MQLMITALEPTGIRLFERMLAGIQENACYVLESRMSRLGDGCACYFLVEGNWNHIARLESVLSGLQPQAHLFFNRVPDSAAEKKSGELLYVADLVARDNDEVLNDVARFFTLQGVVLQDLRSSRYGVPYLDGSVCTMHLLLRIPEGISMLSLRDEFLDFCEQMSVDAILEPIKPVY
ncbi:MAG: glycine cleavage system protein R [Methylohalobius crimeensis]